mgnify:FL=1|tara:strand:+ start:181 stop:393 length:213 start_codon:yes stop_codon:yes gene_type:complete
MNKFETDLYYDYLIRVAVTWHKCGHSWIDAHELMNEQARNMGLNLSLKITHNLINQAVGVWMNNNGGKIK